jgi:hypothetical protein
VSGGLDRFSREFGRFLNRPGAMARSWFGNTEGPSVAAASDNGGVGRVVDPFAGCGGSRCV